MRSTVASVATTEVSERVESLRVANHLVARTLAMLAQHVRPGVSTAKLDDMARQFICDNGAKPGFLGYSGFPYTLCISVNDAVVHGFPSDSELQEGDIVSVDCGTIVNGFYGDSAFTFAVGEISPKARLLLDTTRESLEKGIAVAVAGGRTGDIGYAVQTHAEAQGFGIVREYVGHGLGRTMHENPQIPNYGRRGHGPTLKAGQCICIEPMVTEGKPGVFQMPDGWTVKTKDGKLAAHFEKAIIVQPNGAPEVLTDYEIIDQALQAL